MGWWDGYEKRPAKKVSGGIKSQSKRGAFGTSWWAKRWISVLESFNIGARLGRGRSYARKGQVTNITIEQGIVKAKVQGSRSTPYSVTIRVKTLADKDWKTVKEALNSQVAYAAKLLAGDMPEDIEEVFKDTKLSLLPSTSKDLTTECSCPDWSNPCKHVAAVYYLIGEEFDRDPFLIFKLRGIERAKLLEGLNASSPTEPTDVSAPEPEPLPASLAQFWSEVALPADFFGSVQTPPVSAALLLRLGNFPFWRGSELLVDSLKPLYGRASGQGLELFLGETNHSTK